MQFVKFFIYMSAYVAILVLCSASFTQQSLASDVHLTFQEIDNLPCNIDMNSTIFTTSRVECASICSSNRSCFLYYKAAWKACLCSYNVYNRSETCSVEGVVVGQMDYMYRVKKSVPTQYPHDCLEIYEQGQRKDGIYVIQPVGGNAVDTWCDLSNGGWTVIQRRQDGSENFLRNWTYYVDGFGNKCSEYWLGLDSIHLLTTEPSELYIEMETFGDVTPMSAYARYSTFWVGNSGSHYELSIGGFEGGCGDSLSTHRGLPFSTIDADHDISTGNCAFNFKGAWWYNTCLKSNLNGLYLYGEQSIYAQGVVWMDCWGYYYSLKKVVMKIRRL